MLCFQHATFRLFPYLNNLTMCKLCFCNYCIFDIWKAKTYNLLLFHVKQVVCHAFSKPFYRILNKCSLIFVCNYCFQCQRQRNWVSKAFIQNCITRNNLIITCKNLLKNSCFYEQHQTIFIYASESTLLTNCDAFSLLKGLFTLLKTHDFVFNSVLSSTKWLKIM